MHGATIKKNFLVGCCHKCI